MGWGKVLMGRGVDYIAPSGKMEGVGNPTEPEMRHEKAVGNFHKILKH